MFTFTTLRHGVLSSAMFLLFGACSGGSGNSPPELPMPISNQLPTITSPASLSVAENVTGVVYAAMATDPDGDALSFSIDGIDADTFTIDASTGAIRFVAPPDFESPADQNGDNVYELTLSVSDSNGGRVSLDVSITVSDETDTGQPYLEQVFSDVEVIRDISFAPGLLLDLYTPEGDTRVDRPVMVVASGGGFIAQDREAVEPIAQNFARRGYVAVTIDYRVLGGAPISADELAIAGLKATHDMFAAVRFMRADAEGSNSYGTRGDAIFVSGESAGGVMAATAATLDPSDVFSSIALTDFLAANGGAFGNVGGNSSVSSAINGAMPLSGAVIDLMTIDSNSAPIYAAHEEFDPVVPCATDAEGSSFTGLVVSGACDIAPAYDATGAAAVLYLVAGSVGHVGFTETQRSEIYDGAAALFFNAVISP
ncbi:MAG: carboxylesterase family protein [Pseudomonadota bacterium]